MTPGLQALLNRLRGSQYHLRCLTVHFLQIELPGVLRELLHQVGPQLLLLREDLPPPKKKRVDGHGTPPG